MEGTAPPENDVETVRLAVYRAFARDGRAPDVSEIAEPAGLTNAQVRGALRRLHATRDLVLDAADGQEIVMAHPFSAVPLGFSVMGPDTLWWGGCAWDSFAIPHLLRELPDVLVATRCPGCGAALAWVVGREAPPAGGQVAHFLTPVHRIWDDVVHACGHQRLFCSPDCVNRWLAQTGNPRGYVMDLTTLWRLARGWYAGRIPAARPGIGRRLLRRGGAARAVLGTAGLAQRTGRTGLGSAISHAHAMPPWTAQAFTRGSAVSQRPRRHCAARAAAAGYA